MDHRFGGRFRRDPPEPTSEPAAERRYGGVGAELREERLRLGLELDDIAAMLRIQRHYLAALEEGRHDELPGATYAVGFLRSYASLLGLDSRAVTEAFKEESSVRPGAKQLILPEPIQEARRPRGLAIVVSILVAGAIYAGWTYLSGESRLSLERVSEPPDRLMSLLTGESDSSSEAAPGASEAPAVEALPTAPTAADGAGRDSGPAAGTAVVAVPASDAATEPATSDASQPAQPTTQSTAMTTTAPAAAEPEAGPAAVPLSADEASADEASEDDVPEGVTSGREADVEDAAPASAAAAEPPSVMPARAEQPADDAAPPTSGWTASWRGEQGADESIVAEPAPREDRTSAVPPAFPTATSDATVVTPISTDAGTRPQIYGLANRDARVILRATGDSWVQVEGASNELLLTRLLRAGDSYRVPNRADIVMMTGNAGALEIIVDGQSLGALGADGKVIRDISLDPELLLSMGPNQQYR